MRIHLSLKNKTEVQMEKLINIDYLNEGFTLDDLKSIYPDRCNVRLIQKITYILPVERDGLLFSRTQKVEEKEKNKKQTKLAILVNLSSSPIQLWQDHSAPLCFL